MFKHIMNKEPSIEIKIPISRDLQDLPLHSRIRESHIIQAILMIHQRLGIDKSELKTITVEKVTYNNGKTIQEEAHN